MSSFGQLYGQDNDGDGIADVSDLDKDNDGILDANECSSANLIANGTFENSNNWAFNNWTTGGGSLYASITADGNTPNTNTLTQNMNGLVQGSASLNFSTLFFNGGNQERLDIYLGNTRYASFVSSAGNGNVTVTTENGATVNLNSFPESSSWSTGWQNIVITFPNTSANFSQIIKFDAYRIGSGNGDDVGIDNVSLTIQNCDTDGDGIPNYLDLDSDGDGCFDAIEGGDKVLQSQLDGNGRITGMVNSNGVPTLVNPLGSADIDGLQGQNAGGAFDSTLKYCTDTDGDGIPDIDDLDDDNDGIPDCIEDGFDGNPTSAFRLASSANVVSSPSSGPAYQFRLTNSTSQQGQSWSYGKIDFTKSFSISMKVLLSGADGVAIVFQNSPLGTAATGAVGQGLGARGIANGLALELDTFPNSCDNDVNNAQNCDPSYDHGSIRTTSGWIGAGKLAGDTQLGDGTVDDGLWHDVIIKWNAPGRNLSYTFDGSAVTDYTFPASGSNSLETILGGVSQAYFGFTGSTGAIGSINAIGFDNPCTIPLFFDTDSDGIKDYLDLDSDNDGCSDAIEGGDRVIISQLNPNTSISGSVDANGVPVLVNSGGTADLGNLQGQSVGNSQDATINDCMDNDLDGIPDWQDLDDDNDGIVDITECPSLTERINNGSFISNTNNWILGSGWIYDSNDKNKSVENTTNGSTGTISQNLSSNGINLGLVNGKSYQLTFKLGVQDYINASGSTSSLLIKLGGITYATITNGTNRDNGNITMALTNGATSSFTNFGTINQTGYAYRAVTVTIPYTGTDQTLSFAMNGGNDEWKLDNISLIDAAFCDTDGDGISNYFDLDSDGDGCFDAIEGDENVSFSQLNSTGSINSAVDAQGVPILVNSGGAADIGGDQGQGIGDSQNAGISTACAGAPCYRPGAIATAGNPALISKMGITSLNRAGTQSDNWPMGRTGGWLVLEAKTKGFVPNRIAFNGSENPIGIPPVNFVEGMMVYDTTNKCLKIYTSKDNGSTFNWYCVTTQTCPD